MYRRTIVFSLLSILFLLSASNLFSELPDSTMYPKTLFMRWSFITVEPDTTDAGSAGWEHLKEIDDQYDYEDYDWNDAKTELLRRYDMLLAGAVHVMSFDDDSPAGVKYKVYGDNLGHWHVDSTEYSHTSSGGSQQGLLAKSKLPAERVNADGDSLQQLILASADPVRIEMSYVKNRNNSSNPITTSIKRELADWVSPGWFALGVGSTLKYSLSADVDDDTLWLDDIADSLLFYHACTGKDDVSRCSDLDSTAFSWDDVWAYTFVMVLPESLNDTLEACYDNPPYEIMLLYQSGMSVVSGDLSVGVIRAHRGSLLAHPAGSPIRPLI